MMGCHNIYILVHMLWDTIIFICASPHGCYNIHVQLNMAAVISHVFLHINQPLVCYIRRLGLIFGPNHQHWSQTTGGQTSNSTEPLAWVTFVPLLHPLVQSHQAIGICTHEWILSCKCVDHTHRNAASVGWSGESAWVDRQDIPGVIAAHNLLY